MSAIHGTEMENRNGCLQSAIELRKIWNRVSTNKERQMGIPFRMTEEVDLEVSARRGKLLTRE